MYPASATVRESSKFSVETSAGGAEGQNRLCSEKVPSSRALTLRSEQGEGRTLGAMASAGGKAWASTRPFFLCPRISVPALGLPQCLSHISSEHGHHTQITREVCVQSSSTDNEGAGKNRHLGRLGGGELGTSTFYVVLLCRV